MLLHQWINPTWNIIYVGGEEKKDKGKTCTHPTMKEPRNNGQKEEE